MDRARNFFVAGKILQARDSFIKGEVSSFKPIIPLLDVLKMVGGMREFDGWLVAFWLVGVGQLFGVALLIASWSVGWLREFVSLVGRGRSVGFVVAGIQ